MIGALLLSILCQGSTDLEYLHSVAHAVVDGSRVAVGAAIPNGPTNTSGYAIRVPGATQNYYPAFWIRDAAMMLGGDLVPADEVKGWIKVVAATQPGPEGLNFPHGLRIPPYSIPDHVALDGRACWFPGAYTEQGVGNCGHLPPADDAFYFIQMVAEAHRLDPKSRFLKESVATGWGEQPMLEVARKAFESVDTNPQTGLVVCSENPETDRVDWGFCDSIRKKGECLMPSLLRWQAANRLAELFSAAGDRKAVAEYRKAAAQVRSSVVAAFYQDGRLLSATGLGRKDDVWASAFAVWLKVLPKPIERMVANHLLELYHAGGTVEDGQIRQLPPGESWDSATTGADEYQNGGYWATPTGWMVCALNRVDPTAGARLLREYVSFVRNGRDKGAPFEWINPKTNIYRNANYGSSAGLVYLAITSGIGSGR